MQFHAEVTCIWICLMIEVESCLPHFSCRTVAPAEPWRATTSLIDMRTAAPKTSRKVVEERLRTKIFGISEKIQDGGERQWSASSVPRSGSGDLPGQDADLSGVHPRPAAPLRSRLRPGLSRFAPQGWTNGLRTAAEGSRTPAHPDAATSRFAPVPPRP